MLEQQDKGREKSRPVSRQLMGHIYHGNTRYELGPCLGRGGFGICYKAEKIEDTNNYRFTVAIKKFSIQKIKEANKKPFLKYELALHGSLRHPNIIALYDSFSYEDSIYFVLEYCAQRSLADMLAKNIVLTLPQGSYYFKQLLTGLQYLHSNQILHRDLKVGNLLITETDVLKITDFGLAATVCRSYLERSYICGTPNYLSPEVLLRQGHVPQSDIWSCGVVLYTMFGATPPFQRPELRDIYHSIVDGRFSFSPTHHSDVHVRNVISMILQVDVHKRPNLATLQAHPFIQYADSFHHSNFSNDKKHAETISCAANILPVSCMSIRAAKTDKPNKIVRTSSILGAVTNFFTKTRRRHLMSRSATVMDISDIRVENLLNRLRAKRVWSKKGVHFHGNWVTWWDDKSSVSGFYYQLSNGSCGVIYNDNFTCFEDCKTKRYYFTNLTATCRIFEEQPVDDVTRFFEPVVADLMKTCESAKVKPSPGNDWISWLNYDVGSNPSPSYLEAWSCNPEDEYTVFYLSDESVQIDFAGQFTLRLCGSLCYFYQPVKAGFVVESSSIEVWCRQPANKELVTILCQIFLPSTRSCDDQDT